MRLRLLMSTSAGAAVTAVASDHPSQELLFSSRSPCLLPSFPAAHPSYCALSASKAFSSGPLPELPLRRSHHSPCVFSPSLLFSLPLLCPAESVRYVKGVSNPRRWLADVVEYQKASDKSGRIIILGCALSQWTMCGSSCWQKHKLPSECRSSGQDAQRDACRSLPHAWIHIQRWQHDFSGCEAVLIFSVGKGETHFRLLRTTWLTGWIDKVH